MVKSYTISEFLQLEKEEKYTIERFLKDLKKRKDLYNWLVLVLALIMKTSGVAYSHGIVYASSFESSLGSSAKQIIDLMLVLAQYSFLGLGLKEMIAVMVAGGSFKEAASAGIQYLLTYILIKLYPSLFSMFAGIKF